LVVLLVAEIEFVTDIAIIMSVAALVTVIFYRFKQPIILGYLVAGIILSSLTKSFQIIEHVEIIRILAEWGIILLLFSLGLEFSFKKLRRVSFVALVIGSIQIPFLIVSGYYLGSIFGWSQVDAIFLGAIISISSTAIIFKVLEEMGRLRDLSSNIIFGTLVIEDFGAIIIITILSSMASVGAVSYLDVGGMILRLTIFISAILTLGYAVVPRVINYITKFRVAEVLLLTVLGLCFAVSFFTYYLGFSTATGAFLIGVILAESRHAHEIVRLMSPVRNMFAAIFFVSVGMLFDLSAFIALLIPALIIAAVSMAGKISTSSLGAFLCGYSGRTSLAVGFGKANVGEFSFIIAKVGYDLRVTSGFLYPISIFISVLTTLLTPYFMKVVPLVGKNISKFSPNSLKNSFSHYTIWMARLRREMERRNQRTIPIRNLLKDTFINISVIAFIIATLGILSTYITEQFPLYKTHLDVIFVGVSIGLTFPFIMMTLRNLGRLTNLVGKLLIKTSPTGKGRRYVLQIAKNLIRTLILILIIVLSLTLIPLIRNVASPALLIPAIVAVLILYLYQEYLIGIYDRVEAFYHKILAGENEHTPTDKEKSSTEKTNADLKSNSDNKSNDQSEKR
jgi:CPA2 family monovalent cation:H+ antiporter-2